MNDKKCAFQADRETEWLYGKRPWGCALTQWGYDVMKECNIEKCPIWQKSELGENNER